MVTQITLGNFFTANGRSILTGGASGLDIETLVNGLAEAKAAPARVIEDKIDADAEVSSALTEFQQLLTRFQTASDTLRNPPTLTNFSNNAFAYTTASLSSNTAVAASTYVSVTSSPGTIPQNLGITYITSLASETKQATGTFTVASADTAGIVIDGTPAAGQFKAGSFTIVNGSKTITLTASDTLNTIAQKFNAVSDDTGISATVIQVSSGSYILSFSATETGTANAFDLTSPTYVTDATGVLSQVTITTTNTATNAVFRLDGTTITRSSNSISDVISGLTINLLQVTPDNPASPPATPTTISVSIRPDTTVAQASIESFVDAYNDLRLFFAQQTETSADGTYKSTAILANNSLFRQTINAITSQVGALVSGLAAGQPTSLADIGMVFDYQPATSTTPRVENILNLDTADLASALSTNFSGVANVFQFKMTADNSSLLVTERGLGLETSSFSLIARPFTTQLTRTITIADADTTGVVVAASPTSGQFLAGTVTINGQNITLNTSDTLNTIIGKFNAVTADTGVTASLVTVSAGNYKLSFASSPVAGKSNLFDLNSSTVDPSGVFDEMDVEATGTYTLSYGSGPTTETMTATLLDDSTAVLLEPPDGSALEGFTFIFDGQQTTTVTATITQGIGDVVYNTLEGVISPDTGTLVEELATIEENTADLEEEILEIEEQVAAYRDQLLVKFALLEQALVKINNLLQALNADDLARQQASS